MEGGRERDHVTGYGRRRGGGGDEGDGSSNGVELSLRLTTGSVSPPPPPPAAAEQQEAAAARRSMTIFYNGRVCAVDVTEVQAREIISLASQQSRRDEGHLQDRASAGATARSGGQVRAAAADQAGLSMKRSLQRFLQKREARRAAAVAPPYAGGGQRAQAMRH